MRAELAFIIIVAGWLVLTKIFVYLFAIRDYNKEMKCRRQIPHATAAPKKPTFLNNKKQ
ncbi:MAG: hypothetical protein ABL876_14315 [Chitinophagaceae bacterium]